MTYDDIKSEIRLSNDGDNYGTCMAWHFAISEVLHFERDGTPIAWEFRPTPCADSPENDSYEVDICRDAKTVDLIRIGNLLARWCGLIGARGEDY